MKHDLFHQNCKQIDLHNAVSLRFCRNTRFTAKMIKVQFECVNETFFLCGLFKFESSVCDCNCILYGFRQFLVCILLVWLCVWNFFLIFRWCYRKSHFVRKKMTLLLWYDIISSSQSACYLFYTTIASSFPNAHRP